MEANATKWVTLLSGNESGRIVLSCKIGLGSLGASDVGGAIGGGIDGVVLGPGGVVAGVVLGSATASLSNLGGQVMGCLFDWW